MQKSALFTSDLLKTLLLLWFYLIWYLVVFKVYNFKYYSVLSSDFLQFVSNITSEWKPRLWSRRRRPDSWGLVASLAISLRVCAPFPRITWFSADNRQESDRSEVRSSGITPVLSSVDHLIYNFFLLFCSKAFGVIRFGRPARKRFLENSFAQNIRQIFRAPGVH